MNECDTSSYAKEFMESEKYSLSPSVDSSTTTKCGESNVSSSLSSDDLINFNDGNSNSTVQNQLSIDKLSDSPSIDEATKNVSSINGTPTTTFRDDLQKTLLRLTEELVTLEYRVAPMSVLSETECPTVEREGDSRSARIRYQPDLSSNNLKYFNNILISSQTLFLAAVQAALQQVHRSDLHVNWLALIETTVPMSGRSLTRLSVCVVTQICCNLKLISKCIVEDRSPTSINLRITPKYLSSLMASLTHLTHRLSSIIETLLLVWKAMVHLENNVNDKARLWTILGEPADVKKQILAFLSPISLRDGVHFMGAVGVVWQDFCNDRSASSPTTRKDVIPTCSSYQAMLVEIVAAISELPMETVLQTAKLVIRNPPQSQTTTNTQDTRNKRREPLEVGILQFLLAYIRLFPGSQLIECWKSLLQLLREGLQLGPPAMPLAQFNLLAILHEIVQTVPLIEDRKDQKDLQEVAQKLIDSFTTVISARLAQTRWLCRALEVEPGPQQETSEEDASLVEAPAGGGSASAAGSAGAADSASAYSVQALNALAEFVAPVLDVVYPSDEKEKIVPY